MPTTSRRPSPPWRLRGRRESRGSCSRARTTSWACTSGTSPTPRSSRVRTRPRSSRPAAPGLGRADPSGRPLRDRQGVRRGDRPLLLRGVRALGDLPPHRHRQPQREAGVRAALRDPAHARRPRATRPLLSRCAAVARFGVFYGVSANTWRIWDIEDARAAIDYVPEDDAGRAGADVAAGRLRGGVPGRRRRIPRARRRRTAG